jgi:DNA-binding response OmpR family regulator
LIRRVLEQEGFGVLEAATEEDALQHARTTPEIQLLVTDLELGQGEGARLAQFVGNLHPNSKTIFISGYAEEGAGQGGVYLQKPFSPNTLVLEVRKLLREN